MLLVGAREGVGRCAVQISPPGLPSGHSAPSLDAAPADQTRHPLQAHPGGLILSLSSFPLAFHLTSAMWPTLALP